MRCQSCGKMIEIELDDQYCGFCGARFGMDLGGETQEKMDLAAIQFRLGIVYLKKGYNSLAIEKFKKILIKDPQNLQVKELLDQAVKTRK